jgi:hypothetical protein
VDVTPTNFTLIPFLFLCPFLRPSSSYVSTKIIFVGFLFGYNCAFFGVTDLVTFSTFSLDRGESHLRSSPYREVPERVRPTNFCRKIELFVVFVSFDEIVHFTHWPEKGRQSSIR